LGNSKKLKRNIKSLHKEVDRLFKQHLSDDEIKQKLQPAFKHRFENESLVGVLIDGHLMNLKGLFDTVSTHVTVTSGAKVSFDQMIEKINQLNDGIIVIEGDINGQGISKESETIGSVGNVPSNSLGDGCLSEPTC
jgi:uncharacterized protein (DUF2344 family)